MFRSLFPLFEAYVLLDLSLLLRLISSFVVKHQEVFNGHGIYLPIHALDVDKLEVGRDQMATAVDLKSFLGLWKAQVALVGVIAIVRVVAVTRGGASLQVVDLHVDQALE